VTIEPQVIVHAHTSSFGSILGQASVADVQDALASGQARMDQLGNAYAAFAPTWVNQDHVAFIDWTSDWTTLQNRWKAAVGKANSAVTAAKFSFATPNSMIAAQAEYDGLLKAIRACAPPDGCPVVKGDWDDLNNRLTAAQGHATQYNLPQPTATDIDQAALAVSAPFDPIAMITGQEAPKGPLAALIPGGGSPGAPTSAVKWLFLGAGLGVGGLIGMKIGGLIGALIGGAFGAGTVELMSLELAGAGAKAKSAVKGAAAKSLLSR
jgi:hypothetical protein